MNARKPHLMAIIAALALLLPTFVWATYPAEVARTGQTICYDASGAVIACAGTGQDGDWLAGVPWPDPRFIDNGDGTVTDKLTGLEWAKDANLMKTRDPSFDADGTAGDGSITWQHAIDYVAKLNNEKYLGYSDWRLPNINELESLANAALYGPALPQGHPFTNVKSLGYWSATSGANDAANTLVAGTNGAWVIVMYDGRVNNNYKSDDSYNVWPVRSGQCGSFGNSVICLPKTGQTMCYDENGDLIGCAGTGQDGDIQAGVAWPSQRFVDNSDGTVTDSLTGLEWTKNANPGGLMTWQAALAYVKTLKTGGHSDWRLPNRRELRSLADYTKLNPALPQGHPFTNVQLADSSGSGCYWSSTTALAYGTSSAFIVVMKDSSTNVGVKSSFSLYVWPVRSGQVGNPVISTTTTVLSTTTSVISSTTTTAGGGTSTTTAQATTTISPTTTTTVSGPCPSTQVLGANNPGLENLRNFRDSRLAQSAVGRKIIGMYYNNADSINAALERSPALRAVARRVLEAVAPMARRRQ